MQRMLFLVHQTNQCIRNNQCIIKTSITNTLYLALFLYTLQNDPLLDYVMWGFMMTLMLIIAVHQPQKTYNIMSKVVRFIEHSHTLKSSNNLNVRL